MNDEEKAAQICPALAADQTLACEPETQSCSHVLPGRSLFWLV